MYRRQGVELSRATLGALDRCRC
ncbi:hypothetical protein ACVXHB_04255 [Escherichia coli]